MKIVIEIPKETYKSIKHGMRFKDDVEAIMTQIENGKVLPKGHGALKDADAFIKAECSRCDGQCGVCDCDCLNCKSEWRCEFIKDVDSADVIIEADKEARE